MKKHPLTWDKKSDDSFADADWVDGWLELPETAGEEQMLLIGGKQKPDGKIPCLFYDGDEERLAFVDEKEIGTSEGTITNIIVGGVQIYATVDYDWPLPSLPPPPKQATIRQLIEWIFCPH